MKKKFTLLEIHGHCEKNFLGVQRAFEDNFKKGEELGAALCVYHKGKKVVDIWAGYKNLKHNEAWHEDTMVPFFSVTKGLAALSMLMLLEKHKIKLDTKVSALWTDFGQAGKEKITIRELLEHRSGLHAVTKPLKISDFINNETKVYDALVSQKPFWSPGTKQGYGAQMWGAYIAELYKQIAGESLGSFFNREITKKYKLNVYLGLPETLQYKVARVYPVSSTERIKLMLPHIARGNDTEGKIGRAILKSSSHTRMAFNNPSMGIKGLEVYNEPWLHRKDILWANGIGDARSLGFIFNVLAFGGQNGKIKFLSKKTMEELKKPNLLRTDEVIHKQMGWNLGFLKEQERMFSPNVEAFGHAGMGGCLGYADPKAQIAIAYVGNKMDYRVRAPKSIAICQAIYESL